MIRIDSRHKQQAAFPFLQIRTADIEPAAVFHFYIFDLSFQLVSAAVSMLILLVVHRRQQVIAGNQTSPDQTCFLAQFGEFYLCIVIHET